MCKIVLCIEIAILLEYCHARSNRCLNDRVDDCDDVQAMLKKNPLVTLTKSLLRQKDC